MSQESTGYSMWTLHRILPLSTNKKINSKLANCKHILTKYKFLEIRNKIFITSNKSYVNLWFI